MNSPLPTKQMTNLIMASKHKIHAVYVSNDVIENMSNQFVLRCVVAGGWKVNDSTSFSVWNSSQLKQMMSAIERCRDSAGKLLRPSIAEQQLQGVRFDRHGFKIYGN
ncbi:hypothetical protein M2G93_16960 [Vibrio vulnificus]|uniref:hypothetical protein n=1 Tax=Vibrio vulnificus TaxID=672 RepID=UPI0021D866F2|nr:hypothetical protein [Vibrio vulnificus]EKZ9225813.1 hypothetical protein [Vibrio vulnificus]MCU8149807.1 hypothetical protein [Vibrio vulnificus]MCU8385864.1 hypothetical protein [Vibrio vulnificus]